ncbi:MAG: GntR family transcriptional regulator [Caldivirga sp.]
METRLLVDKVYEELLNAIIQGKFKPGQVLREDKVASMIGASRTPVREALARLEREGFVVKDKRSYVVTPITKEDVIQLYEARIPLEAMAARLAAQRATDEQLARMNSIIEAIKVEVMQPNPNPIKLADLNGEFHELVAEASGNKVISSVLKQIRLKLKIVRVNIFTSYSRRLEETREHGEVYEAIASRNADAAFIKMLTHEQNVLEYVKNNVLPYYF